MRIPFVSNVSIAFMLLLCTQAFGEELVVRLSLTGGGSNDVNRVVGNSILVRPSGKPISNLASTGNHEVSHNSSMIFRVYTTSEVNAIVESLKASHKEEVAALQKQIVAEREIREATNLKLKESLDSIGVDLFADEGFRALLKEFVKK